MQTLLIFDVIPESQIRVLIPDAPDWLPKVDGLFVNDDDLTDEQEAMLLRVSDALCQEPKHCNNPDDPLALQWRKLEIPPLAIIDGPVQVVRCGFLV